MPTPVPGKKGPSGSARRTTDGIQRFYNEPIGPATDPVSLNFSDQDIILTETRSGWVAQAQEALERVQQQLDRIGGGSLQVMQGGDDLGRCDISDLVEETSKWHDNLYYREELKKYTEPRVYRTSLAALPSKKKERLDSVMAEDGAEGGEEEEASTNGGAAKKRKVANSKAKGKGKGKGKAAEGTPELAQEVEEEEDDEVPMDKEVQQFVEAAEEKTLAILKPWDSEFYLRKTKVSDINCIPEVRRAFAPAPFPAPLDNSVDPLSNILLTITFHPISKVTRKIHTSPQLQTFICVASNTLGELRDNLTAGGDAIPKRLDPSQARIANEGSPEGENEDSDRESRAEATNGEYGIGELDELGTIAAATRKNVSGRFGIEDQPGESENGKRFDENGKEILEWSEERRVTGACFGIEGVFYPDLNGEEKTDYAQMLLEAIDKTKWSDKNGKRFTGRRGRYRRQRENSDSEDEEDDDDEGSPAPSSASSVASPINPRSNDISVHSTPAPPDFDNIDPLLRNGYVENGDMTMRDGSILEGGGDQSTALEKEDPNKPQFVAGTPMHETKLGDIALRVGQPYWFVHQGNYEHVWTIDSIRWRHPSDPPITAPTSNHPYPLTTYLSRHLSHKCHICDRDPAILFLLNDFSASENPSYVCQACYDCLHPEIPTERDLERIRRKEERIEEKRLAKEERKKAVLRERRKIRRKNKPKDDDSVGSDGDNEPNELDELPVAEEESENETEEEEEIIHEVRARKYMEGVEVVPTVIER